MDTGDGGLFLDGTVDHCPAGLVPLSDAGSPVLLLKPGAVELVEIPSVAWDPGEGVKIINGSLDTDGRLTLTWDYRVTGNQGRQWRNAMTGRGSRLDDYIRDGLMPEGLAMRGGKPEVRGMDDWRGPLEISLAAESDRPLHGDERSVFLPRVLTGSALDFDPRLVCDRPVDLRMGLRRRESWSIELPAGMVLAGPDSLSLVEQGVAWSSRVWQEGRVLRLERALTFDDMTLLADQADELEKRLRKATRLDDGYLELVWK